MASDAPINLNKVRKARVQTEKSARANANAVRFGLSKAEKASVAAEVEREARRLDGHQRKDR